MTTSLDQSENDLNIGDKEDQTTSSLLFLLGKRLLFPSLAFVFVILYIRNTWSMISFSNLLYPYFIITCLLGLLMSIYASEIIDVYRHRDKLSASVATDVRETYLEWRLSIWVVLVAVAYLFSIEYLGFFISSFVMLIVMMKIGGVKKWSTTVLVAMGALLFVYVMFINVLGVRPPTGPIEVF